MATRFPWARHAPAPIRALVERLIGAAPETLDLGGQDPTVRFVVGSMGLVDKTLPDEGAGGLVSTTALFYKPDQKRKPKGKGGGQFEETGADEKQKADAFTAAAIKKAKAYAKEQAKKAEQAQAAADASGIAWAAEAKKLHEQAKAANVATAAAPVAVLDTPTEKLVVTPTGGAVSAQGTKLSKWLTTPSEALEKVTQHFAEKGAVVAEGKVVPPPGLPIHLQVDHVDTVLTMLIGGPPAGATTAEKAVYKALLASVTEQYDLLTQVQMASLKKPEYQPTVDQVQDAREYMEERGVELTQEGEVAIPSGLTKPERIKWLVDMSDAMLKAAESQHGNDLSETLLSLQDKVLVQLQVENDKPEQPAAKKPGKATANPQEAGLPPEPLTLGQPQNYRDRKAVAPYYKKLQAGYKKARSVYVKEMVAAALDRSAFDFMRSKRVQDRLKAYDAELAVIEDVSGLGLSIPKGTPKTTLQGTDVSFFAANVVSMQRRYDAILAAKDAVVAAYEKKGMTWGQTASDPIVASLEHEQGLAQGLLEESKQNYQAAITVDPEATAQRKLAELDALYQGDKLADVGDGYPASNKADDLITELNALSGVHGLAVELPKGFAEDLYKSGEQMNLPGMQGVVAPDGTVLDPARYDLAGDSFSEWGSKSTSTAHNEVALDAYYQDWAGNLDSDTQSYITEYMSSLYEPLNTYLRTGSSEGVPEFDADAAAYEYDSTDDEQYFDDNMAEDAITEYLKDNNAPQYGDGEYMDPATGEFDDEKYEADLQTWRDEHQADIDQYVQRQKDEYTARQQGEFVQEAEDDFNEKHPDHTGGNDMDDVANSIDDAFESAPGAPDNMILWRRGLLEEDPAEVRDPNDVLEEGEIVYDNAFISTSLNSHTAENFQGDRFKIEVPKGSKVAWLAGVGGGGEAEMLLPRGSRFLVLDTDETDYGESTYKLRYLGPEYDPSAVPGLASAALPPKYLTDEQGVETYNPAYWEAVSPYDDPLDSLEAKDQAATVGGFDWDSWYKKAKQQPKKAAFSRTELRLVNKTRSAESLRAEDERLTWKPGDLKRTGKRMPIIRPPKPDAAPTAPPSVPQARPSGPRSAFSTPTGSVGAVEGVEALRMALRGATKVGGSVLALFYRRDQRRDRYGKWIDEGRAKAKLQTLTAVAPAKAPAKAAGASAAAPGATGARPPKGPAPGDEPYPWKAPIPTPPLPAQGAGPTANFMWRPMKGAAGSNQGGFYQGTDGVQRYVKEYDDPTQARAEHLANAIYEKLGVPVPKSLVWTEGGQTYYGSTIVHNTDERNQVGKLGLTPQRADAILDGFVADVLTANRDVLGQDYDNVLDINKDYTEGGEIGSLIYRVDNGSAFLHRAQGARKEGDLRNIDEWDSLAPGGRNANYARVFEVAGYPTVEAAKNKVLPQVRKLEAVYAALPAGKWATFVDATVPEMDREDKTAIAGILEARTKALVAKAGATRVTVPMLSAPTTQVPAVLSTRPDAGLVAADKPSSPSGATAPAPEAAPDAHPYAGATQRAYGPEGDGGSGKDLANREKIVNTQMLMLLVQDGVFAYDAQAMRNAAVRRDFREVVEEIDSAKVDKAKWFSTVTRVAGAYAEVMNLPDQTPRPERVNLGVTPFRGKPKDTVEATEGYYESTRYKGWLQDVKTEALRTGTEIEDIVKVAGVWQGTLEPSASVWVLGDPKGVRSMAEALGAEYNQEGVLMFDTTDDDGEGALYTLPGVKDRDEAVKAMQKHGIDGGRIVEARNHEYVVEVMDFDGSLADNVASLAKALHTEQYWTPGRVSLLEGGVDYQRRSRPHQGRGSTYQTPERTVAGVVTPDPNNGRKKKALAGRAT